MNKSENTFLNNRTFECLSSYGTRHTALQYASVADTTQIFQTAKFLLPIRGRQNMYTASHNTGIIFTVKLKQTNTALYIMLSVVVELGYGQLKCGYEVVL